MNGGETSAPALAGGPAGALEVQVERLRRAAGSDAPAASATDAAAAAEG
jgi:hypothetical protein